MRHDLRVSLRALRRSPAFTLTTLVILALGIGMAVAMFTVYDAVVIRDLPVRDQDRVVELYTYKGDPTVDYQLLREDLPRALAASRTLADIAGVVHWGAPKTPMLDGDRPLALNRTLVTGNFFDVLGARASMGRLFRPSDEQPGAPPVIVISHGVWRAQFAADPDIIGKDSVIIRANMRVDPNHSRQAFGLADVRRIEVNRRRPGEALTTGGAIGALAGLVLVTGDDQKRRNAVLIGALVGGLIGPVAIRDRWETVFRR